MQGNSRFTAAGATRITAAGRSITAFKPGGHWTRSLLASKDGRKLYVDMSFGVVTGRDGAVLGSVAISVSFCCALVC